MIEKVALLLKILCRFHISQILVKMTRSLLTPLHQIKVGNEVLYFFFEIMPRLKKGVMIHFHDIFWPFEYPEEWVEVGRSWNESYGLHTFLQYNDSFEILFFNSYIGNAYKKIFNEKMPFGDEVSDEISSAGDTPAAAYG